MARHKQTEDALFRRGVAQLLAKRIASDGWTLTKLKFLQLDELEALGIATDAAKRIQAGRPPISQDVVTRLMHECRRTCCVCRKANHSLVLHHLDEWAKSRSHDEKSLVVLCLHCHGEAHTKRGLGKDLTSNDILGHKKLWAKRVRETEARILFDRSSRASLLGLGPVWDYFNHRRIIRTAHELSIEPMSLAGFSSLGANAPVDQNGAIDWDVIQSNGKTTTGFIYSGAMRNSDGVYSYFSDLLTAIVCESDWIDLRSIWTIPKIKAVVAPGALVVLTAGFRFRSNGTMLSNGPEQFRDGYYRKAGIKLQFKFDAWEVTTASSKGNLSGSWRSTVICIVRSIEEIESKMVLNTTCLGIGTGFDNTYSPEPNIGQIQDRYDM